MIKPINQSPFSTCSLDHSPRFCLKARAEYLDLQQSLFNRFGDIIDTSACRDESIIQLVIDTMIPLRIKDSDARNGKRCCDCDCNLEDNE